MSELSSYPKRIWWEGWWRELYLVPILHHGGLKQDMCLFGDPIYLESEDLEWEQEGDNLMYIFEINLSQVWVWEKLYTYFRNSKTSDLDAHHLGMNFTWLISAMVCWVSSWKSTAQTEPDLFDTGICSGLDGGSQEICLCPNPWNLLMSPKVWKGPLQM